MIRCIQRFHVIFTMTTLNVHQTREFRVIVSTVVCENHAEEQENTIIVVDSTVDRTFRTSRPFA